MQTELKTRVFKSHYGWTAESMTEADANGQAWQISTSKRSNGIVSCSAIQGKSERGMFSYEMFGAKRLELAQIKGQATEKAIRVTHEAGIIKFNELIQAEPEIVKPSYVIEVGQIIFTDGPGYDPQKRVIYEIPKPGTYKTVFLDGTDFATEDRIKCYGEKFGIGVYYNEGETMDPSKVQELVEAATVYQQDQNQAQEIEEARLKAERLEKIEAGKLIIDRIPAGVASVIIAELHEDNSDGQTDYYSYSTKKTVFLAWSTHKRDIFSELRKAAGKYEETKKYAIIPEKPEGSSEHWTPEDENREKYSMGAGYYLGDSKYSGWVIKKSRSEFNNPRFLEVLQIAAAEGRFFCDDVQTEEKAIPTVQDGSVKIIEHPFRAGKILVIGETRPIKEELKAIGGWWNRFEKAWEYKAEKAQEIINLLQKLAAHV